MFTNTAAVTTVTGASIKYAVDSDPPAITSEASLTSTFSGLAIDIEARASSDHPREEVVVCGDSIAAGEPFKTYFNTPFGGTTYENQPQWQVSRNLAFGGRTVADDGSQTWTWIATGGALDYVLGDHSSQSRSDPTRVVLMFGVNDVAAGDSNATITGKMDTVRAGIASSIKLYVCSVLPWNGGSSAQKAAILSLNAAYESWCDDNNATYIDTYTALEDPDNAGNIRSDWISGDNLHPTTDGYRVLGRVIAEALIGGVQLLGEITHTVTSDDGGTGWPAALRKGDAYLASNGRQFNITLQDSNGNALSSLGGTNFGDAATEAAFRFTKLKNQGGEAAFVGVLNWVATGTPHFELTIADTETDKAVAGETYRGQLILWPDQTNETTALEQCFEINPKIAAPSS